MSAGCGGTYTVARGDTLYSIARRCRSSVIDIARASGLADPRRIEIGQRLVIPGAGAPPLSAASDKPDPVREREVTLSYNFRPGDTIYSLARWSRVSVGALIAANPGINPHKIEIGDNVRLPTGAVSPEPARLRERGTGPGPAFALRPPMIGVRERMPGTPAPAPPRVHSERQRPAPPPPRSDKPEDEDDRAPEGM
jgi:LysM repeat protein